MIHAFLHRRSAVPTKATRCPVIVFLSSRDFSSDQDTFICEYDVRPGTSNNFQAFLGNHTDMHGMDVSLGPWFEQFIASGVAADFCFISPGNDDEDDDAKAFRQHMQQRLHDGEDTEAEHEALLEMWSQSFDFLARMYDYCLGEGRRGIMTQVGSALCDTLAINLQPTSELSSIVDRMKISQQQSSTRAHHGGGDGGKNWEVGCT